MSTLIYQIEFFDYWHAGTGLVSGANSDALVNKDDEGRPFIPGKTLKGLLREAAEVLKELGHAEITDDFIIKVFGKKKLDDNEQMTVNGQNRMDVEAKSFFGNATLSDHLIKNIDQSKSKHLYRQLASTAIEKNGQAKDFSLRNVEVTIPLVLYAPISSIDMNHKKPLELCLAWVKRLGLNRNRGLGRCQLTFI
ncbi:MAG TPA: CRISPR-associated protein [Saprospiraceae bacterium]|nr:CRISPR-associated protein [Saprospiraceae bacterium]